MPAKLQISKNHLKFESADNFATNISFTISIEDSRNLARFARVGFEVEYCSLLLCDGGYLQMCLKSITIYNR